MTMDGRLGEWRASLWAGEPGVHRSGPKYPPHRPRPRHRHVQRRWTQIVLEGPFPDQGVQLQTSGLRVASLLWDHVPVEAVTVGPGVPPSDEELSIEHVTAQCVEALAQDLRGDVVSVPPPREASCQTLAVKFAVDAEGGMYEQEGSWVLCARQVWIGGCWEGAWMIVGHALPF